MTPFGLEFGDNPVRFPRRTNDSPQHEDRGNKNPWKDERKINRSVECLTDDQIPANQLQGGEVAKPLGHIRSPNRPQTPTDPAHNAN